MQIRSSSDKIHFSVTLHFYPVRVVSGEYDRLEIFNVAIKEELFSIEKCYDWIVYVRASKKVYFDDWMSLSIAGEIIEDFLKMIMIMSQFV